jgi:hypothetical protein
MIKGMDDQEQGNLIKIHKNKAKESSCFLYFSSQIIEVSHCAERSDKAI